MSDDADETDDERPHWHRPTPRRCYERDHKPPASGRCDECRRYRDARRKLYPHTYRPWLLAKAKWKRKDYARKRAARLARLTGTT